MGDCTPRNKWAAQIGPSGLLKKKTETGMGLEVAVNLGGVGGVEMMCSKYVM